MNMLRLLYETNINAGYSKHKVDVEHLPQNFEVEDDENVKMVTDTLNDETDDLQDVMIKSETEAEGVDIHYDTTDEENQNDRFKNKSGSIFPLFLAPMAQEHLPLKGAGLSGRGDSDIESVPKVLRNTIIEGHTFNLLRLLLPHDNKRYRRDDEDKSDILN
jgi:hypothetical protein